MTEKLTAERLIEALSDDSFDAGISITSELEPMGGPGAPVKPAVYINGALQKDKRWFGEGENREIVDAVVIDNAPSQANRLEFALLRNIDSFEYRLPELVLDLSGCEHLPPHIDAELSSFLFPHRCADSYLRDADIEGVAFGRTDIGKAVFTATPSAPLALMEWFPQALLYGFWQSHLGNKGPQTKLARSWTSEIVGYKPATDDVKTGGLKGDPLNLSVEEAIKYNDQDNLDWQFIGSDRKGSKSGDTLAEIGHGQVPVSVKDGAPAAISFSRVQQHATLSFAGLRNISTADSAQTAKARAVLAALGIAAHANAFNRGFTLRSRADLTVANTNWQWLGETGRTAIAAPSIQEANDLFNDVVRLAEAAGLPVGSQWAKLSLTPNKSLAKALAKTFPAHSLYTEAG